jgi:hypothetical protein
MVTEGRGLAGAAGTAVPPATLPTVEPGDGDGAILFCSRGGGGRSGKFAARADPSASQTITAAAMRLPDFGEFRGPLLLDVMRVLMFIR